tara:strand:- start:7112 stop:7387 length:276 start_codon:yes stop_codon:yes gene_type:complete
MWILNSWKKDAFFIILSGPLIFLLMNFVGERSVELALLAILFLDSGHAYTTIFRTVFHEKKEYRLGVILPSSFNSLSGCFSLASSKDTLSF